MEKKLHRNTDGQMLCGVCNGIAEYFNADVSLIRLITVAAGLCSAGTVIFAYLAAAVILPDEKQWK
jgi:phage shock protein PspC (stress-responsive transcriptional regulator)